MDYSTAILGSTTVNKLKARNILPILTIGGDTFLKRDLAGVECYNWTAATNLTNLIAQIGVKNTKELYEKIPPTALALPRMGDISMAVLGAAFEAKGLGNGTPLESWWRKHAEKTDHMVTFNSIKRREALEILNESKAIRTRKIGRKTQAHKLRSERFLNGKAGVNGHASAAG